jgi:AspT/YidE/YbjL antiporter-like protein
VLGTAWLTAYRALFTKSGLRVGETVLVQGATGGMATALIQLGRAAGFEVWVTSRSPEGQARARALGAHESFPANEPLPRKVRAVIDSVGVDTLVHSLSSLARGGILLVNDFGGGPRPWKFAWAMNFQKTGTFPLHAVLIAWYQNTGTAAWIYLAMHGSYGLVWIIKDLAFPDPAWQRRVTVGGGTNALLSVLGWYWVFGRLLISGTSQPTYPLPEYAWLCLCVSLCILGCVIMIAANAQKYFTLRLKRGLITDGMFRQRHVEEAARALGYANRPRANVDVVHVALGIALGALIGAPALPLGGVSLGLGAAGGILLTGLAFGWLRARRPTFGRFPMPAMWVFEVLGLHLFLAAVGISAGLAFVAGLAQRGAGLLPAGVAVSLVPHAVTLLAGRRLFPSLHPGVLLGACAGAGVSSAALEALEEAAGSKVPALGYNVPYAVGNTLLTLAGPLLVALVQ